MLISLVVFIVDFRWAYISFSVFFHESGENPKFNMAAIAFYHLLRLVSWVALHCLACAGFKLLEHFAHGLARIQTKFTTLASISKVVEAKQLPLPKVVIWPKYAFQGWQN